MKWQRLTSDLEFDLFKEKYLSRSGFDVSIEDLKRYDVYGFFDRGTLLGGFWLIQSAPYRTLDTLSPEYLKSDAAFSKALKRRLVEMGGMWKDKSVVGFGPSASYFVQGMFRILRGVRVDAWLLFGYDHHHEYLSRFYGPCSPFMLYRGPVIRPGENGGRTVHGTICAAPKTSMLVCGTLAIGRNLLWALSGKKGKPKRAPRPPIEESLSLPLVQH